MQVRCFEIMDMLVKASDKLLELISIYMLLVYFVRLNLLVCRVNDFYFWPGKEVS